MEERSDLGHLRHLAKDLAEYSLAFAVPGLIGFIAIPIITRLFAADMYGEYALVMATVSLMSSLLSWTPVAVIRFYPAYERDGGLKQFYMTSIVLTFVSTGLLAFICLLTLYAFRTRMESNLFRLLSIGVFLLATLSMFNVLKQFLRAKRYVRWYTAFSVWYSVAGLGIGLALVLLGALGIEGLLWGRVLVILVIIPALWTKAVGRFGVRLKGGISKQLAWNMAKYGFPLAIGNLAAWILNLSDRYVIAAFRGSHELGIYSASYAISEKSLMLGVSIFGIAAVPIAMHIWEKEGEAASQRFTSQSTRYYLIALVPMLVGLSVLAKPVMDVLTAPEYREAYKVIPIVALSVFFLGLTQRFGIGFCYRNVTYYVTLALAVSGLLNLALNALLVPTYGYLAAAWTTLISYGVYLVLQVVLSRRFFAWDFPFRSLARASLASALMGAAVYPVGNSLTSSGLINLVVAISLGVAVYSSALFLLGEIQPNEKRAVKRVLARYLPGLTPSSWK